MLQIKIFSNESEHVVEEEVNKWIKDNPEFFIKDVKLSEVVLQESEVWYCTAMIIYQTNTLGVSNG